MVQHKKQPNRVLRRAWGSLIKKASNRSLQTEDDNSHHGCERHPVDEKTQFSRAPNSSWLAGPLAGATSVYKNYSHCCGRNSRGRNERTVVESQSEVEIDGRGLDKEAWIGNAAHVIDRFDHKNYR